jgi:sugar transferase (PEP-CTERM system associated)
MLEMHGDLLATARREKADIIVVALSERRGVLPLQDMMQCKLNGIEVLDAPTFYEIVQGKLVLEQMTPSWIIFSAGFRRTALVNVYKRCIDILLSIVGLLLSAPLFPFIALAIKLETPGPIFFTQIRVGSGEKPFLLYKFRSMGRDAEQKSGAVWAAKNDARVTRVGRFLRNSRIDEIPQLYNVLKGEMSFIGPRPERPEFVEMLKKDIYYYSKRHTIKPGLTGWAQVRYPYGATAEDAVEKLRYDLYYIKNLSMLLDSQIIFETVKVVLFGRGGR